MVTSSFLGWDLLSEQGLMSSFPLQRPLFSPSARLAALFFPILPLLPVEQARWDLPDRRYRLFTLLHETISSALPISLRISWVFIVQRSRNATSSCSRRWNCGFCTA